MTASRARHADARDRWLQRWRHSLPWRWRLAVSVGAGALGGLLAGALDVVWVRRQAPGSGAWELWLAAAGLLVPWTALVGLGVGAGSVAVHPDRAPTLSGLVARLRGYGVGRPADVAAFVPLAVLAAFAWVVLAGALARRLLALELAPRPAGLLLGLCALALGGALGLGVLALVPWLRTRLARGATRYGRLVDPAFLLGASLAVCVLVGAYGVWRGDVSGGGGLLGIFGVLKRQELDLRLVGVLAALVLACYLAPGVATGSRPWVGWALALASLLLTVRAAPALDRHPELAQALERHAPLGRPALHALRRAFDRDGDGASRWFAGGDCDDRNAAVGPAAEDLPDNGVDEDCSGADLSLAGAPVPTAAPPPADAISRVPKDGNLLLLSIDALRADVGYAGYARPTTPNIDALARRSVIFDRAYTLASYTGKAVGPMLIGKYGSETHRNWGHFNVFGPEDTFVAERLQRAGIRTLSVQGHRYFGKFGGLDRGFDVVDLSVAPPEGADWATDSAITSDKLADAVLALLAKPENTAKPFFLWVHFLDPHADYKRHPDAPNFGSGARDLYDSEVAFTDRQLGRIVDFVATTPWASRTSIIVTSDHGEAFGDNGMWRHGFELWEALVHVPLVVHVPGVEPHHVVARRSLIDLVPTILDLLRVPQPVASGTDFLSGVSLLGDVFPDPGSTPAERDVLVDMPAGPYNEARRAFIHGDWKLIVSRDSHKELFDLADDPGETKDLWGKERARIERPYELARARLREVKVTGGKR